jgi:hypothetical protein
MVSVCVRVFIWVSAHTCMSICVCTVFLKQVIYTQDIHKNIHTISLKFTVHIHNIDKFNSQIVYSQ